jgi:hypothetical protein
MTAVKRLGIVFLGLLTWVALGGLLLLSLRFTWPAYEAAQATKSFTLAMLISRQFIGAFATLVAGFVVARFSGVAAKATLLLGALLFLLNLPIHLSDPVWSDYPLWYHIVFLTYLLPLTIFGGKLANKATLNPQL